MNQTQQCIEKPQASTGRRASATPITDAFEDRVVNGDERRAPLVYPLTNRIDYCAAYGEAVEAMAALEHDRARLIEALRFIANRPTADDNEDGGELNALIARATAALREARVAL